MSRAATPGRVRWLAGPPVLILAWWATSLRPFTGPALVVTLAAGLAAFAVGRWMQGGKTPPWEGPWSGLALWAVLVAALAAWELGAFLQLPRAEHPTLSFLANAIFDSHPVRAAAFLVWLAAGVGIARR